MVAMHVKTKSAKRLTLAMAQFPITLLKVTQGQPMLVETKNGETFNGHLEQCDTWMNLHLKEVVCTSRNGDRFWHMPEAYIRGNTIKYIRVPDEMLAKVEEESEKRAQERASASGRGRGRGRGGPGRDGGGRGGGGVHEGGRRGRGSRGGRSHGNTT